MVAVVCAGLAALAVAGAALAASTAGVKVTPERGSQHSTFTVSFTARDASGQHGSWIRTYEVGAVGPRADGCRAQADSIPDVRAGQRVRVRLAPRSRWCGGSFAGRVYEIEVTRCAKNHSCPIVIHIKSLGRFSFRVRQ